MCIPVEKVSGTQAMTSPEFGLSNSVRRKEAGPEDSAADGGAWTQDCFPLVLQSRLEALLVESHLNYAADCLEEQCH